jgi:hypothetical protein
MKRMHPRLAWLHALHEPAPTLRWTLAEWEYVVRLARRLRLLARLAARVEAAGLIEQVPTEPRRHLRAEQRLSRFRTQALLWAVDRIGATLAGASYPRVLLKGAAYVAQDLSIAQGRLPSDVDILVPIAHVTHAQALLARAGWQEIHLDEHARRYYREWSHEFPPLHHPQHRIELDLHHNILPPIARTHVDAEALFSCLTPSKWPGWQLLQPVDQVLHSAAHLFLDSEARDRVRDLVDLDGLLRQFGKEPSFWRELPDRANVIGLREPLALACHFCHSWLATPIPAGTLGRIVDGGLSAIRRAWLLPMMRHILTPRGPDQTRTWQQDLAAGLFLARYHRNRMPLALLLPHLWHKVHQRASAINGDALGHRKAE